MTAAPEFFTSRWVDRPEHVRETVGMPVAFRAGGVAAQIKPSGKPDLALIVSDAPRTTSAARFTRSGVQAAPVLLCRERCELHGLRAIVANAGNANAATGRQGLDVATKTQGAAALMLGVADARVAVASTGVIGVQLPVDKVLKGLLRLNDELRWDGDPEAAEAIMTTDAFPKRACLEVELPGGTVKLSAQAKGAGMIQPGFATMFCFVQTDAELSAATADLLLGVTVKRSFERISVDGQLSTNDTAILMASGASGITVDPETEDELRLGEALDALLRQLAILMVADGEGSERVARVVVRGGDDAGVERAARAVANSPLVKAALHGGDPNWGRIAQSVGMALPGTAPLALDISIEGVDVCRGGTGVPFDRDDLDSKAGGKEIEYVIGLPGEGAETEVFFSDLGHEYVRINAEYTT
jgi:glutamate N-acetyltransferase/amino-acid N-acetyltransferase